MTRANDKKRFKHGVALFGIIAAVFFSLCFFLMLYSIRTFMIPSGSMIPTFHVGDRIVVNKLAYKKAIPKRGDIVVFKSPADKRKDLVKRVVGLPGETIEIKNGRVVVNGMLLKEPASITNCYYYNQGNYGNERQIVKIPEDSYFMLGDNSGSSRDSRFIGPVSRNLILGRVFGIYYPFNRYKNIN